MDKNNQNPEKESNRSCRLQFDFSDDRESAFTMDDILDKYDAVIICIAFGQLFQVGISNLRQMNVEEECRKASFCCTNSDLIPYSMQKQVICCAAELSQLNRSELIRFAKLRYPLSGVCMTEGKILHFKANATDEHIAYCVVDSEVEDRYIDAAYRVLEERLEKLDKKNNGDFSGVDIRAEISEAFKTAGILVRGIRCYKEYVI